jgi:hypothetical protein
MKRIVEKLKSLPRFIAMGIAALLLLIVFVYYPVGMVMVHNIDDSEKFSADEYNVPNGSHSVAMAIALIDRETNKNRWVSSDPFFFPGAALTRMPAFQRGIMASLSRFSIEMYDQIGRTRGSSQADTDLQKANGLLNYSPYVWMFDFSTSWLPTTSSPTQYRAAMESLKTYNKRLSEGKAVFDRRADNLIETLNRIASDLGSSSASIATFVETRSGLSFNGSADLYYNTKGRLYGNYLLLREMKLDFADIIKEKQLDSVWDQMLDSFRDGMRLHNFLVFNARPDSQFFPNHLATQGFFVMRARTQLYEVTNILLK